jgi:hypothetical protein
MTRPCRVCGMPFRPVRFDALVCSNTCAKRKSRGGDLAYLATMPPDQASAQRMNHEIVDFEIATKRDARAARREGRQVRRGMLKARRIRTASPGP